MDELTSLGLILLLALLAGHLVKVVRIPEVSGYILAGVALGPSVLGWVSAENLLAIEVLSEVALGLILFSIGSVFEFSRFRRIGRQVLNLTLAESVLASLLVTAGMLAMGQPWQVALLLGAVAIETAPRVRRPSATSVRTMSVAEAHGFSRRTWHSSLRVSTDSARPWPRSWRGCGCRACSPPVRYA